MPMVYVLIPAHNNKNEVLELLDCLRRQTWKETEIVLVDDGSTDNTEEEVRARHPETILLKGNGGLWWTGANVLGVNYIQDRAQDNDFILLLNNDLTVNEKYIETLVNTSLQYERAIVGSVLVDYHNHDFVESGVTFDHQLNLTVNRNSKIINSTEFDLNVDTLPGRGTLVPIEVFKTVGNFNLKKLPHYGADYEFSTRSKRAGYSLLIAHNARVYAKLNITGLNCSGERTLSLNKCMALLFNKKSKTNLYYYLNFVWLCSDKKHRVANLLRSARGILMETIGKTYPFKIVIAPIAVSVGGLKRLILFIYGFLYVFLLKSYPLRRSDIEAQNLAPETLVASSILSEIEFRGRIFYNINSDVPASHAVSSSDMAEISRLKRLSFNYLHKIAIICVKINLLVTVERTDEI